MAFNKLGGIYYTETTEIIPLDNGGSIPCFIGRTINPLKLREEAEEQAYIEKAKTLLGGTPTEAQIQTKVAELKASTETSDKPSESDITSKYTPLKATALEGRKINQLQVFNNFTQVNRSVSNGGLGLYDDEKEQNPLLNFINEFCEETDLMTEEYVACPYFYVIDLGTAESLTDWIASIETSKSKKEIDFEVYIGWDTTLTTTTTDNVTTKNITSATIKDGNNNADFVSFILAVNYDLIANRQPNGDFRKAFYTLQKIGSDNNYCNNLYYKEHYTTIDKELIDFTALLVNNNDTQFHLNETTNSYDGITNETTNTISKSRVYVAEPLHFGKTIGRIAITPYDMEPGYYAYNTLDIDDIILRKPQEKIALQVGGVIFNHLEETSTEEYVKINRTQSVSSRLVNHPSDSLFQSRHLVDYLITKVFDAVYPQIKNKETETNIEYLRTQVNKIVNDAIADGDFIAPYVVNNERKGTFLNVQESSEDAYDLEVVGMVQPVNCTYTIHIIAQINDAKVKITEG